MALLRMGVAPKIQPYAVHRPLTAAAQTVNLKDIRQVDALMKRSSQITWQAEAWEYFDAIGEINYAFSLFSDVMSRIRIHAAYVEDDESSPLRISQSPASEEAKKSAQRAMNRVFGNGRQSELMKMAALNLLVAGEFYLVNTPANVMLGIPEKWEVVASDQLRYEKGRGYWIRTSASQSKTDELLIPEKSFCGRVWNNCIWGPCSNDYFKLHMWCGYGGVVCNGNQ